MTAGPGLIPKRVPIFNINSFYPVIHLCYCGERLKSSYGLPGTMPRDAGLVHWHSFLPGDVSHICDMGQILEKYLFEAKTEEYL
jgi:hypothetical protein